MNSLLDTDKYTKIAYNHYTGRDERQWLMYGDDTVEPVRKDGKLSRKYNADPRGVDWFVMGKPKDWDPVKEGYNVSLNHDFGQQDKPGGPPKTKPVTTGREKSKQQLRLADKAQGVKGNLNLNEKALLKTTLGRGPEAYQEFEGRRQAQKAETQSHDKTNDNLPYEGVWEEVDLPGKGKTHFAKPFNDKFKKWQESNGEDGIELEFTSGFRKTKKQSAINRAPTSQWVSAKPGTSLHEAASAVDVRWDKRKHDYPNGMTSEQWEKTIENAKKAGLEWGGKFKDDIHFYLEVPGGRKNRKSWIGAAQGNATNWE